jgi:hypothetical protein
MLHVGLDVSRKKLDYLALSEDGTRADVGASPPDDDGLRSLARRLDRHGEPIQAAIESMNGARFADMRSRACAGVWPRLTLSLRRGRRAGAHGAAVRGRRAGPGRQALRTSP